MAAQLSEEEEEEEQQQQLSNKTEKYGKHLLFPHQSSDVASSKHSSSASSSKLDLFQAKAFRDLRSPVKKKTAKTTGQMGKMHRIALEYFWQRGRLEF